MSRQPSRYETEYATFRWNVPTSFNIGVDVCDRHAAGALALIDRSADGRVTEYRFGDLKAHGRESFDFFTDRKIVISRWS